MKKIVKVMLISVMLMMISVASFAQTANKNQRMTREQLAVAQAKHIAHDLALDDKVTDLFIETYTDCQKEIWALGPRQRRNVNGTDNQAEQQIRQRFEMSEKILNIRQKYYQRYSKFLTQKQIQRVYEIEKNMRKRLTKRAQMRGGKGQHRQRPDLSW